MADKIGKSKESGAFPPKLKWEMIILSLLAQKVIAASAVPPGTRLSQEELGQVHTVHMATSNKINVHRAGNI